MNLDEHIQHLKGIFEPIKNGERDFYQTIARLLESIAKCSQHVNKSHEVEIAEQLPTLFAWYCSLIVKAKPADSRMNEILWSKYPGCCPYCLSIPCTCPRNKKELSDRTVDLQEKANANLSFKPESLSKWQELFAKIYPRNPQGYDQKSNFIHLIEEVGETAEAYRLNYFYPDNIDNELADVLTWILGIANLIDAKANENPSTFRGASSFNLEDKVLERYRDGCPTCEKPQCCCFGKEVKEKISESFKLYPEDVFRHFESLASKVSSVEKDIRGDLSHIMKSQDGITTSFEELAQKLIEESKDKPWYKKLTAEGVAEGVIVNAVSAIIAGIAKTVAN